MLQYKPFLVHVTITCLLLLQYLKAANPRPQIAKPGCKDHCGNVTIPYPFGIGPNCYHNPWFDVECYNASDSFKLKKITTGTVNLDGIQINWNGKRNLISVVPCYRVCQGDGNPRSMLIGNSDNLTGSPFLYSRRGNVLLVNGCGGGIILRDKRNKTIAGCAAVCTTNATAPGIDCYGVDCCQTTISNSVDYYSMELASMGKTPIVEDACTRAVLVDSKWIANKRKNLMHFQGLCDPARVVIEWSVEDLDVDSPSYGNSSCVKKAASVDDAGGYVCRCKQDFYEGNPYLPQGCQVVKECERCVQDCISLGNHTFGCPQTEKKLNTATIAVLIGLGTSLVLLLVLLGLSLLLRAIKRNRDVRLKAKYFERNGGLLLKQQMSSQKNNIEKIEILSSNELEKATDKYNEDRILGQGGQGTVYKGMLSDGNIVAIKKSKIEDESQLNIFINEVVILSQINHRNVVKLLGCCLETEVPMLVYEYIPNGTLSDLIHDSKQDFAITWEMRLHIGTDIANALAYLHSSYLIPILHRDIKSSNILLDSKYRAKLSDFGISKSLSIDQTHVSTRVVGTIGYLDPGYYQSEQYTDKSDVYSFGVVLVELLTGQKAIRASNEHEEKSLVAWFLAHMEKCNLYDILDSRVLREGKEEEIMVVSNLAKRCLNLDGKRRPKMKEVAAELETVRSSMQRGLMKMQSGSSNQHDQSFNSLLEITTEEFITLD
ncbi:unnamed protein product [Amaranthus hypochondriacus]